MSIRILPAEVASQIAAGEVIERPASVVKELVENSLDSGASVIEITTTDSGRTLIEVSDNGSGIPADELPLAVERHGTSKLSRAADLFHIRTLGFRGEALASIGSVSRMTITSRSIGSELGARLQVEGGRDHTLQGIGAPNGTVVRVENLFFNIPARLKFLKSNATERRLIDNLVTRYALAYPKVRFRLQQEERPALQTSGNGDRREVLAALYGVETARQMLEVLFKDDLVSIMGFISPTSITRTHRREIHFFTNGRPVWDATLNTALFKAYHSFLMVGRYPLATLFLELSPDLVDVNVHPTKAEIRFTEPDRIFSSVQNAVRRALLAHNPVPGLEAGMGWNIPPLFGGSRENEDLLRGTDHLLMQPTGNLPLTWDNRSEPENQPGLPHLSTEPSQPVLFEDRVSILRPIGQIASAYLVAEGPDGLYLVDQHAAHERVLFERFMAQAGAQTPSQTLLQPVTVELVSEQARLLDEQIPLLNSIGFQVEPFGTGTYLIRSVPVLISDSNPAMVLRSIVENFEEDETPLQNHAQARLIARICKRSAVKAGKSLSHEEQKALLLALESCQSPRTCPHGRPTMIHLSVDLLERQFGRRGAR